MKCQSLDENGNKCLNIAEIETYCFIDSSTISYTISCPWNTVFLCGKHAKERKVSLKETQNYN